MPKRSHSSARSEVGVLFLLGLAFFMYSLCESAVIQLYVVPQVFPQFNLGDGLVEPDPIGFNEVAKAKSIEIIEVGWGAWELRPHMHSPAGIASIFYTIWAPKPYSLLPFNALVHALSGCLILWILRQFFPWQPTIFGGSLFVINPAALEWVAQIHKDGVFILGNLMVLVCLMQMGKGLKLSKVETIVCGFLWGVGGTSVVWVGRPQWAQVLFVSVFLCSCLLGLYFWVTRVKQDEV